MGSSQADKSASHDRIVDIAAAHMRRNGIKGVGVEPFAPLEGLLLLPQLVRALGESLLPATTNVVVAPFRQLPTRRRCSVTLELLIMLH